MGWNIIGTPHITFSRSLCCGWFTLTPAHGNKEGGAKEPRSQGTGRWLPGAGRRLVSPRRLSKARVPHLRRSVVVKLSTVKGLGHVAIYGWRPGDTHGGRAEASKREVGGRLETRTAGWRTATWLLWVTRPAVLCAELDPGCSLPIADCRSTALVVLFGLRY